MPPTYRLEVSPAARKQLERLSAPVQVRVRLAIRGLAGNPRPRGAALVLGGGPERVWRIRVGDYRVMYELQDDVLLVLVIRIGHRREIYRGRRIGEESAPYERGVDRPQPHGGRSWARDVLYSDRPDGERLFRSPAAEDERYGHER